MGAFKEGDWVRRVERSDWPSQHGEVGKIYKVLSSIAAGIVVIAGEPEADPSAFEPWTPKVGERVRMVRAADGHKAECGATVVRDDLRSPMRFLLELDECCEWAHNGAGAAKEDRGWWVDASDIEPLTVAAEAAAVSQERANAGGGFKAGDKIELVEGAIDGLRAIGDIYEAVAHKSPTHKDSVRYVTGMARKRGLLVDFSSFTSLQHR